MSLFDRARTLVRRTPDRTARRPLALALQGGGSFGAFTWGALDRLLENPDLRLDAISGASAGAVNAALLASGLAEGGPETARARLAAFWRRMSETASVLKMATLPPGVGALARSLSPYQLNPFDINPLRRALEDMVDFERLRAASAPRLLVATTRVRDGALRIFRNEELDVDVILASACLPLIQQAVRVDGEDYWDGGYAANPPLIPLVHESAASDVLVVQVTPARNGETPTIRRDIVRRLEQITFNATLNAEIEALRLAVRLGATERLRALRVDRIAAEEEIQGLADRSAADLDANFVAELREAGRRAAGAWLDERVAAAA